MVLPRNSGLTALMRSHISLTDALVEAGAFRSCLTISNCAERLFSTRIRTIDVQRGADCGSHNSKRTIRGTCSLKIE